MELVYLISLAVGGVAGLLSAAFTLARRGAESDQRGTRTPGARAYSWRAFSYTVFGFGAVGSLLTLLGAPPNSALTIAFSVLAGLVIGGSMGVTVNYMRRPEPRSSTGENPAREE